MATTNWRSSLGNIETRLRRSLGIAGPIALEISKDLTPVVISDDSTRPGASSSFRGRRFKGALALSIAAATNGSVWAYCETPEGATRTDPYAGGVIIDMIDITPVVPALPASILQIGLVFFPTPLVLTPGIPVAVTEDLFYFSDPLRVPTEFAPVSGGFGNAVQVQTNGGRLLWYRGFRCDGVASVKLPVDLFLNWNSCVAVGNLTNVASQLDLYVNVHGRIF